MTTVRSIAFANDYVYHIYNRGVERRNIFNDKRDRLRFLNTIRYYQFINIPIRYSKFLQLSYDTKEQILLNIRSSKQYIDILSYCFMPNHFHLLLKQNKENGISKFMSDISNSYSKYFNTKNSRVGPLFQGSFKASFVEKEEQLIHVSRYIHINPIVSSIVSKSKLDTYVWSSLPSYINNIYDGITKTKLVLSQFPSVKSYKDFVYDQIDYAKELENIKHLTFEN